jgi:AcrR family transcriptional regulator
MTTLPRSKQTSTSDRTREQLILAGERLIGTLGIDNVSLRQINTAAGQRNSSAAHYHFGSKEALLEAIYDYRAGKVDVLRKRFMEDVGSGGRMKDSRALVEALIYPLVDHIESAEGGSFYIRFMAQYMGHPSLNLQQMARGQFSNTVGDIYFALRQLLPEIPDEVFGARFGLMWELTIHALADRARLADIASKTDTMTYTLPVLFVSNLTDTAHAIMCAAVSAATTAEVQRLRNSVMLSA